MTVFIKPDGARYRLWVRSPVVGETPAGPRLFRLATPVIAFVTDTHEQAIKQQEKLQECLDTREGPRDR